MPMRRTHALLLVVVLCICTQPTVADCVQRQQLLEVAAAVAPPSTPLAGCFCTWGDPFSCNISTPGYNRTDPCCGDVTVPVGLTMEFREVDFAKVAQNGPISGLEMLSLEKVTFLGPFEWICTNKDLRFLALQWMELSMVPHCVENLTSLSTLDLSANNLVTLPDFLGQLSQLRVLRVGSNHLTDVPASLSTLILDELVLDDNRLSTVPLLLQQLPQLQLLGMAYNRLTSLPPWMASMTQLTSLDVSYNRIRALPAWVGQFTSLTSLFLSGNSLVSLPSSLGNLNRLQVLAVAKCQLRELPDTFSALTYLNELHLSQNLLTRVPEAITTFTRLTELHMDDNRLTQLPSNFSQLAQLSLLDVSSNQLTSLPVGLNPKLDTLKASKNRIRELPSDFGTLQALSDLELANNQLTSLPSEVGSMSQLFILLLSNNALTELPPMHSMPTLNNLDVSNNQLTKFPTTTAPMTLLRTVSLGRNKISTIPKDILNMVALRSLSLASNCLTSIPDELGRLPLLFLSLEDNQLTELPDSVANISTLLDLFVAKNQLQEVPETIGNARGMVHLDLSSNRLARIPDSIGLLTGLESISLSNNLISSLPASFAQLQGLRTLTLANNRFSSFPPSLYPLSLAILDVSFNQLLVLGNMTRLGRLVELDASSNALIGLPQQMGSELETLRLANNRISGIVTMGILPSNLAYLDLSANSIEHVDIDVEMPALRYLDFSHNPSMQGDVTSASLPSIEEFKAYNTQLSGSLEHWSSLAQLQRLDLHGSHIGGGFPSSMMDSTALWYVDVTGTQMRLETGETGFLQAVEGEARTFGNVTCASVGRGGKGAGKQLLFFYEPEQWFSMCGCSNGFFGRRRTCLPCAEEFSRCQCRSGWIEGCRAVTAPGNTTQLLAVLPCPVADACVRVAPSQDESGNVVDGSLSCAQGYRNGSRLCSECDTGYYRSGRVCSKCPSGWEAVLSLVLFALGGLAFVFVVRRQKLHHGGSSATLKVVLFFWQILATIERSSISLTTAVHQGAAGVVGSVQGGQAGSVSGVGRLVQGLMGFVHTVASSVNLSVGSLECLFAAPPGFTERWNGGFVASMTLVVPLVLVGVCMSLAWRWWRRWRTRGRGEAAMLQEHGSSVVASMEEEEEEGDKDGSNEFGWHGEAGGVGIKHQVAGLALFVLHVAYGPVLLQAMSFLMCTDANTGVSDDKVWFLNQLPFIQCRGAGAARDTTLQSVQGVSWTLFVLVGVGLPLFDGCALWYLQRTGKAEEPWAQVALGFLFRSYKRKYMSYELVVFARRIMVTVLVTGVPFYDQMTFFGMLFFTLLLSIWIHGQARPFVREFDNRMETLSLYTLVSVFVTGTAVTLSRKGFDSATVEGMALGVVVVTVVVGVSMMVAVVWKAVKNGITRMRMWTGRGRGGWKQLEAVAAGDAIEPLIGED